MKLMDEVAGIVAARHCKTNIVTASVDAINFHEKIKKGTRVAVGALLSCSAASRLPWVLTLAETLFPVRLVLVRRSSAQGLSIKPRGPLAPFP